VREIACDESGYEGEKFIDSTKPLFAHASVLIDADAAARCLAELRRRVGSPAVQYKAGHLLRAKNRPALEWFLGPRSGMPGQGYVYLIDKVYFVVRTVAHLFDLDADELHRSGPARFGPDRWPLFLAAANDLLRSKDRDGVVDEFFRITAGRLPAGRMRAELFRAWLREDPIGNSVLDPLVPAIVAAVRHWGPVRVAHDRQTQLPAPRLVRLQELCGDRLIGLRFVDAVSDPRIQLADMLAGTVRAIAADDWDGRGDPVLADLARPYIAPSSVRPGRVVET
jgi:Protein of unknown function (DUF3800)